jgi:cyclase
VTFEDGLTLHLNGQTIEIRQVPPAHTDGNSIVRFVEADVIHMGGTYFAGIYPYIDTTSGGEVDGMIAAADRGLEWSGPNPRIIPGHGPLSQPADLRKLREMLISFCDRVRKVKELGLERRDVIRARPSKSFDAEFGGGFMTPGRFVGAVFDRMDQ